jgi:hypothetical protein
MRLRQDHRNGLEIGDRLVRLHRRDRMTAVILFMAAGMRRSICRSLRQTEAATHPAHHKNEAEQDWHRDWHDAPHLLRR